MRQRIPQALFAMLMLCFSTISKAQIYDVPISTLDHHSSLIVEGKIVGYTTVWNQSRTRIYTQYQIEVADFLKGRSAQLIDVVRLGGCIDEDCQRLFPELKMGLGQEGVLFLRPFKDEDLFQDNLYEVVSGPLGFVSFEEMDGKIVGANALRIFYNLNTEIYIPIAGRPKLTEHQASIQHSPDALAITSFSPDTVAGGINDTLTIIGTDFGLSKGKVWFQDADRPGGLFMRGDTTDIGIWTDTLIKVVVPTEASMDSMFNGVAGTGPIRVETNSGMTVQSAPDLFVKYAYRNRRVEFNLESYTTLLNTPSGSTTGGYTFRFDTTFTDSIKASQVFKKALRDWRCATLVNFRVGADTTIRHFGRDDVNAVYWDTLDPGTLGETFVDERFCRDDASGITYYHTNEIDIRLSQTDNFYIDTVGVPAFTQFDFYSVILHELGHAHLLQHINRQGFLMHFAVSNGTTVRTIHPEMLEGGLVVMDSSTMNHNPSCPSPIIPISQNNCNSLSRTNSKNSFPGTVTIFPNPSISFAHLEIEIRHKLQFLNIEICDISGHLIRQKSLGVNAPGRKSTDIYLNNLEQGYYMVKVSSDRGTTTMPLIILH